MNTKLNTTSSASPTQRLLSTHDSWAPLALRLAGGAIFVAHGAQKLFGAFGGYGLDGTGQFFDSLGLSPGYLMALLAGAAELLGGLALILGLLVRPAAAALAFTMFVAVFAVHFDKGFFLDKGGYEYALAMLAVSLSLLFSGGGRVSLDRLISGKMA
jgi:putative oxidoreductase